MTVQEIIKKYGKPGDAINFTSIELPFPMRIAWDKSKTVSKMTCHKLVGESLKKALTEILSHYGLAKIKELEIDIFGGCFNHRPMRGLEAKYDAAIAAGKLELAATYLSKHSWAVAIDLNPEKNGLKTKWANAQFSKPEYKPMVDIFERNGWYNQGKYKDNDGMHFQTIPFK